jgi:hypothetical protein
MIDSYRQLLCCCKDCIGDVIEDVILIFLSPLSLNSDQVGNQQSEYSISVMFALLLPFLLLPPLSVVLYDLLSVLVH